MTRFIIIAAVSVLATATGRADPSVAAAGDTIPAVSSAVCGDFNGDGWVVVTDMLFSLRYLYQDGPPPWNFNWADADGYYLYTLNDLAVLTRALFGAGGAPVCPPGPGKLDGPERDSIYLHTFETTYPAATIFPPGQDKMAVHFHLSTDTALMTACLAFSIRVGGEVPTIDSVTLPTSDAESFQYASKVDHDSGLVTIGLIATNSEDRIEPGTHEYGYVHLSVPPLDSVWRPIMIAWSSLSPQQGGENAHYPYVVGANPGEVWRPVISHFPCLGLIRGNINYDSTDAIDISDLVYLVTYMFQQGQPPKCFEECDMEVNLQLDVGDLIYMVNYMFNSGPPPAPCP